MKAKQLFEKAQIPAFFSQREVTKIHCANGSVYVTPQRDGRFYITATKQRAMFVGLEDVKEVVRELVNYLD